MSEKKVRSGITICGIDFHPNGNKSWRSEELKGLNGKFFILRESKRHVYTLSMRKRKGGAVSRVEQHGKDLEQLVLESVSRYIADMQLAAQVMLERAHEAVLLHRNMVNIPLPLKSNGGEQHATVS